MPHFGAVRQPKHQAPIDDEMMPRGRQVHDARIDLVPVLRVLDVQLGLALKDLPEKAWSRQGAMLNDRDRQGKARRQMRQHLRDRLDASCRRANHDDPKTPPDAHYRFSLAVFILGHRRRNLSCPGRKTTNIASCGVFAWSSEPLCAIHRVLEVVAVLQSRNGMSPIKRILVPIDFGETSDGAADMAISLAATLGASVTLMHAFEIPVMSFPDGSIVASAEVLSGITTAAQTALTAAAAKRSNRGVAVDTLLRDGAPADEINAAALAMKADLVVIGTHGRRGLARILLGSVAEKVVRTCACPVLTVRGAPTSETTDVGSQTTALTANGQT